jgi:iron complex outermembrane recepter protein
MPRGGAQIMATAVSRSARLNRTRVVQYPRALASAAAVLALCGVPCQGLAQQQGPPPKADYSGAKLEEVIVTAQKREERLQDVPVPVTVLDAQALVESNHISMSQYYSSIPSLNYTPSGPTGTELSIRGLSPFGGSTTVAVLIDGVPFGTGSVISAAHWGVPDFDPGIIKNIEVLRGPQGTLFGSGSIGGLINFVTTAPSTDSLSGRVQADLSDVYNGNGPGYGSRGSINLPLGDTLAIRANAFARYDAGYVDNIATSQKGVNWGDTDGGRIAALWTPSEMFSVQLSGLAQNETVHGDSHVFIAPGFGDLQQSDLANSAWSHSVEQDYSLIAKLHEEGFELTSSTGYNINQFDYNVDSPTLAQYAQMFFGVTGSTAPVNSKNDKFTEELRLSTSLGKHIDWLLGAFYSHDASSNVQFLDANDASTGAFVGAYATYLWSSTFAEDAVFTDLTFHFTDRFDVQVGGRESLNRQAYQETDSGVSNLLFEGVPSPAVYPTEYTRQSAFTYLLTPRLRLSEDSMVYARIASGYRPGGPNFNDLGLLAKDVPPAFGADRTKNYELGLKGSAFDRKLTVDASIYYIDWTDLQLSLVNSEGLAYQGNAGSAKSQGVELAVDSQPWENFTFSAWFVWSDAVLTQGFAADVAAFGNAGDPLPQSSRRSGYFSFQRDFSLGPQMTGFVGGDETYVGERFGNFLTTPGGVRANLPSYAETDLRVGVRRKAWTVNLFANNITDKRGVLNGGPGSGSIPAAFYIIQPRTIGLSLAWSF